MCSLNHKNLAYLHVGVMRFTDLILYCANVNLLILLMMPEIRH